LPLRVKQILLVNTLVPILALMVLGSLLGWQLWRVNQASEWVNHSAEVRRVVNRAIAALNQMESGQRGFLLAEEPAFKAPFDEGRTLLEQQLDALGRLVADSPAQTARVNEARAQHSAWEVAASQEMALRQAHDPAFQTVFRAGRGAKLLAATRDALDALREDEMRLQAERQATEDRETRAAGAIGGAAFLLAAGFFGLFSRRQFGQLEAAFQENLEMVQAQGEELQAQNEELTAQTEELQAQSEEIQAQSEELLQQNEELAAMSTRAEAANRMKSEFLANMSHELRTPLNSIIGYTELVVLNPKVELPDRARDNLHVVLRNGKHLLALINDILDLSKIEAGKATVYAQPVELPLLLASVKGVTEPMAREKGLELEIDVPPGLDGVVSDETKLRQIVLNLVGNAVKFTRAGKVTVQARPAGPEALEIRVVDTGIGIAPEHQGLVFEEFRQVDGSTTRESGGTGLGLAISRKLATLLGGSLELERSAADQGSTFVLHLPRLAPGVVLPPAPALPEVPVASAEGDQRQVVVIDDDPEVLHLVAEKLRDTAYAVVPASSGESGLDLARRLKPYAITLDVMMPYMDGWSVLRALKEDPETRNIPVLILSFLENKLMGFSLGASAYLTKPVDRDRLLESLDRFDGALRRGNGYVLVVDDDRDARGLYVQILGKEGVRLQEAADGREAIAAIEQEPPALVILDLMMPSVDGFEVMAWLRSHHLTERVPVIVVTAKELTPEDLRRLSEARRVVPKQAFTPQLLEPDLQALLDRQGGQA
jgi:signal transduction histidine kinase/DNA-binding response OmpR family regulator